MNKLILILSIIILISILSIMALYSSKTYFVNSDKCIGCGLCEEVCPNNAISMVNGKAVIDIEKCNDCQKCVKVCPTKAISLIEKKDASSITKKKNHFLEKDTAKKSVSEVKENVKQVAISKSNLVKKENIKKPRKSVSKKIKEISQKVIYSVKTSQCIGCKICVRKCPVNAISMVNGKAVIDVDKCIECGICENVCPTEAISHTKNILNNSQKNDDLKIKKVARKINSSHNKNQKEKILLEKDTAKKAVSEVKENVKQVAISKSNPAKKKNIKEPRKSVSKKIKEISQKVIYSVKTSQCVGCKICVRKCPVNAISMVNGKAVIDVDKCIECGICENVCPTEAISHTKNILNNSQKKDDLKIKKVARKINSSHNKNQKEKILLEKDTAKKAVSEVKIVKDIKKKINFLINKFKCVGCNDCVDTCPVNAIKIINGKAVIEQSKCISCGKCVDACTYDAIEGK